MTERCQRKFTKDLNNRNYFLYSVLFVIAVIIFYCYKFHFVTVTVSYVLGCSACYFGFNSTFLRSYIDKLKLLSFCDDTNVDSVETLQPKTGCLACGAANCKRHDVSLNLEPWEGLRVHKQLDQAIEDFYNAILENFVNSWYSKISLQPFLVDELRLQLRYASATLLKRAVKINYAHFLMTRLIPCALRHYALYAESAGEPRKAGDASVPGEEGAASARRGVLHPAVTSRASELRYLRSLAQALMMHLLRPYDLHNRVFKVLVREIFAGWVLLPLTDVLADPYILNTLIILATGHDRMADLPKSPDYRVVFLENFVRQTETVYTRRNKLLKMDLDMVLSNPDYLYAFMQFMKTTQHLHLLQFCKEIKAFQLKILNPDLGIKEEISLFNEAWDLYLSYIEPAQGRAVLPGELAEELRAVLVAGAPGVARLQTSRALYQAERAASHTLETHFLPQFLHSDQFYKLYFGSRVPTGYHKQMTKKPQENLVLSALKLGYKLKGALRPQAMEGQVLDCFTNPGLVQDGDAAENMDILRYLDSLTENPALSEQDLSSWKIALTDAESRVQGPSRRGTTRVFTIAVHRADPLCADASLWSVRRSEHDFHLLRSKLQEFHGDGLLLDLVPPSPRDNSPLETLRYKYEDFLQRLLQKSLLRTSELLRIFLSADGAFAPAARAASLAAGGSDAANIYQAVAHRLRKEKGQHLEPFMNAYLVSTDIERFQAMKQGREVEEGQEVSEAGGVVAGVRRARDARSRTFGDLFGEPAPRALSTPGPHQHCLRGFTQCLMYLLVKVIRARAAVCGVVGSVCVLLRDVADRWFDARLNSVLLTVLSQRRLAHLIRLGHGLLFVKKWDGAREDGSAHCERARHQLLAALGYGARSLLGPGLPHAALAAHAALQHPHLNKQLLYNLLDLCVAELFPELAEHGEDDKAKS